jgi:ribosomal protein S18 acetylase RimI-like enzyme
VVDAGAARSQCSDVPESEIITAGGVRLVLRRLTGEHEAAACAAIMSTSEPWVTLGRSYDRSLAVVGDPDAEVYVAVGPEPAAVAGFLVLTMRGAFTGYIRTVALHAEWRGRGLGTALIAFAERRILRETPNVFLCVSSFNGRARALYLRLGYEVVGELRDYLVRGHSEWLLRKSVAPLAEFTAPMPAPAGGA